MFVRDLSDRVEREQQREQLYREQAARQEAEHMAEMVQGLQLLLDAALAHGRLEQILELLVPRLCEVLSAEAAAIFLTDEATGELVLRASTAEVHDRVVARAQHISARVGDSRSPLLVNNPPDDELADPGMRGMASVIAVPLTAGEDVTGVIQVGVPAPRKFDEDNLLLLGLAADRVALAIDHALVFEREHRIAETLQRSLLPERLPVLPGLEVAARYIPAASEAEVGGDWYDVIPIDSSRVGLVMGDVAGKGLAAASMVGRLRSAMRAYALEGREPADVIGSLNQLVWSEVEDSEMATLVYAVADPVASTLTWVNAGHPPPLILAADGTTSFLEGPRSVPLGVMPFPSYEEGTAPLPEGGTLLLYTDGLVERPGELLDDGFARLAAAADGSEVAAERACDHVLERLVPTGRDGRRRGAAGPAHPAPVRALPAGAPARAAPAVVHARAAAPLAGLGGRQRGRRRRDPGGRRRGLRQRHRARGADHPPGLHALGVRVRRQRGAHGQRPRPLAPDRWRRAAGAACR